MPLILSLSNLKSKLYLIKPYFIISKAVIMYNLARLVYFIKRFVFEMIIELLVIVGAYSGLRIFENKKSDTKTQDDSSSSKNIVPRFLQSDENKSEKEINEDCVSRVKISSIVLATSFLRDIHPSFAILNLATATVGFASTFRVAEENFRKKGRPDGYFLYAVADSLTYGIGSYKIAAFGLTMLNVSDLLVQKINNRSKNMLKKRVIVDAFAENDNSIWVFRDGVEIETPINLLKEGDIVVLGAGEIVPADGEVIEGFAFIDERSLSGESMPFEKVVGSAIFASTLITSGNIKMCVKKAGSETTIAKIGERLEHSLEFKTKTELKGEKLANKGVIPILGLSAATLPFYGLNGSIVVLNAHIAEHIRVVAPLATLNYLVKTSYHGILIKDGQALEELASIDTFVFDKTGTLTTGELIVSKIYTANSFSEDCVLFFAAVAQQRVAHPIAKAIVKKAFEKNIELVDAQNSDYRVGRGLKYQYDGKEVVVGSHIFAAEEGCSIDLSLIDRKDEENLSTVWVFVDGILCGYLLLSSESRDGLKDSIELLRKNGIKNIYIISGDHEKPTKALAQELEVDNYFFDITPEKKGDIIKELKSSGKKVCFVGDGINDTIAMGEADVSISLKGATSLATDMAQIVLIDVKLENLNYLVSISKELDRNINRSLMLSVSSGMIVLGGLFFFNIGILSAMLIDGALYSISIGNSMLPLKDVKIDKDILKDYEKREQEMKRAIKENPKID